MPRCVVFQPFDGGKFDKRYDDVFAPAIKAAGLDAYRVDRDPSSVVPIDTVEEEIKSSSACLAEITTNNPNVWYELGFASALGRPIVLVCSSERQPKKFPFDIQHRAIVTYDVESPQDFERLKSKITERLHALLAKHRVLEEISAGSPLSNVEGLSQTELIVLAASSVNCLDPDRFVPAQHVRFDVENAGFTNVAHVIGVRKLVSKKLIETDHIFDPGESESYPAIRITAAGWDWIERNEDKFILKRERRVSSDDDIPF